VSKLHFIRRSGSAALLLGLCLSTSALAGNKLPSITVQAVASKTVVGRSTIGAPIEQATLTRRVHYADLDLTTYTGAMTLKERVREAAREACRKLDDLYPLEERQAPTCIEKAVADASRQVDGSIGRAQQVAKAR
jgi:UrcA family protein